MPTNSISCEQNVFCCQVNSFAILLLIVAFILYMGIVHFLNWIVFYCMYTVVPYVIAGMLYIIAPLILLCGVACSSPVLIRVFPWFAFLGLVANLVYVIMLFVDQKCIADNLEWIASGHVYHIAILTVYGYLGFIAGINFIVTLYCILVVADYLEECEDDECYSNCPTN